jgi:alpha-1,6-mannosyltransferase
MLREGRRLLALAVLLAAAQAGMIALAPALVEQAAPAPAYVLAFIGLALLGGAAWFAAIGPLERLPPRRAAIGVVLVFGAAMRLGWLGTPLVLDTDALRYLWDGALVAHGIWPWAAPPGSGLPPELGEAGAALHAVLPFAGLRSIYPGTAQLAFLLAHWVAPWELLGLRLVMLGAEAAGVLLLAALLRRAGLPVMRAAVWWCCPLLPLVLTNAAHVDALLPPLLLGALLATLGGRGGLAGGLLGLAAGVKVWPLLLVPLLARWLPAHARTRAAVAFGLVAAVALAPLLATVTAPDAGLAAYAQGWLVNNAPLAWAQAAFGPGVGDVLRPLLGLAGATVALVVARHAPGEPAALLRGALVVAAATFYLSPAQYPWYAVWFLPFAAALGCRALLLPAVLLPLYYAFFPLHALGLGAVFGQGVAAIHLMGVLLMLGLSTIRQKERR